MKIYYFVFLILFSSKVMSFELTRFDYSKHNIHHTRMIRNALVDFAISHEKHTKYKKDSFVFLQNYIFKNAYANNVSCFYGGWPTKLVGNTCESPSVHANDFAKDINCKDPYSDETLACNDIIDTTYNSCGVKGQFRCNAMLFGFDNKGQGKCISVSDSPSSITKRCYEETKGTEGLDRNAKFLKENPELLKKYIDNVEKFCQQTQSGKRDGNKRSCKALKDRLNEISGDIAEEEQIQREQEQNDAMATSRALGVLDKCQKDYDASKDGAVSRFFASKRNSISQIIQYGRCHNQEIADDVTSDEVDNLIRDINKTSTVPLSKEMVIDSVSSGLELTLKNLMITMYQFGDEVSEKSIMRKYSHLKKSPYKQVVEKAIGDFYKAKRNLSDQIIDKNKMAEKFNDFGTKVNRLCQEINSDYIRRTKMKSGPEKIDDGFFTNTESEQNYYNETQKKIRSAYEEFMATDPVNISRLMATDHFKSDIFPYSEKMSEYCAEGDIDNRAFTPVVIDDFDEAMDDYKDLMKDEISDYNSIAKGNDYHDSLKDLIKYRPYLLGNFLRKNNQDQDALKAYAAILCDKTRDVYSSDEYWRIGEVAAGGAGLVVSGLLVATGVGSPLGAALAASSATLVAAEGAIAVSTYVDADNTQDANDAAFASQGINLGTHTQNEERASGKKTEAIIAGSFAAVQPLSMLKGAKVGSQFTKSTLPTRFVSEGSSGTSVVTRGTQAADTGTEVAVKGKSVVKSGSPSKGSSSRKARRDANARKQQEKRAQEKAEADRRAKAEADRKAKEEAERKAKAEADRKAKEEAQRRAKAEADRKAKEEAQRKAAAGSQTTKADVSKAILESNPNIKMLPTDALAKFSPPASVHGVKNILKSITGKDYSNFTNRELQKEIRKLTTTFHPDKYASKGKGFSDIMNEEMQVINMLKDKVK